MVSASSVPLLGVHVVTRSGLNEVLPCIQQSQDTCGIEVMSCLQASQAYLVGHYENKMLDGLNGPLA